MWYKVEWPGASLEEGGILQIYGRVAQHTMKKWALSDLRFCKNEGSKKTKEQ